MADHEPIEAVAGIITLVCSGRAKATCNLSASSIHPDWAAKSRAFCVHPCKTTTNGDEAGSPLGMCLNILRLPGFDPKSVTSTGAAKACGAATRASERAQRP